MWALGCVCVWLLTGSTPFADDKSHDQIVDRIAVGNWEAARAQLPDTLSYECLDLLEGMLQVVSPQWCLPVLSGYSKMIYTRTSENESRFSES